MKRKLSLLAIVVALILVLTMIFVACNKKDDDADTSGGSNITADYNYEQIASKVTELANANGLFVKLHISSTNNGQTDTYDIALGVHGQVYYVLSYGNEVYLDLTSDQYYDVYTPYNGTWRKVRTNYSEQVTKESLVTTYSAMIYGYFGMYQYLTSYEGVKTTATVAGRSCDKYTFTQTAYGATASSEVCIDKATGICLKWAAAGSYQGDSGAVTFECTQFDTSYTATLPQDGQAVTPSGGGQQGSGEGGQQGGSGEQGQGGQQGGSGEGGQQQGSGEQGGEGETSAFAGKKLDVTNTQVSYSSPILMSGGYIQLYTNNNWEFISNDLCLLGTWMAINNTAYLNPTKMYVDGAYDYDTASYMDELVLVYDADNNEYTTSFATTVRSSALTASLTLENAGNVSAHDDTVCPLDPNGYEFDGYYYQITPVIWDGIFNGEYLFEDIGNFTVNYSITGGVYPVSGKFLVDDDFFNDNDQIIHSRNTYVKDGNGQYSFYEYYSDGNGGYNYYGLGDFDLTDWWDQFTGAIPADFMKASYNSVGHYYYINSYRYTPPGESQRSITNFRAYFSYGLLQKIQFTYSGENYEYIYSAYDSTVVADPTL